MISWLWLPVLLLNFLDFMVVCSEPRHVNVFIVYSNDQFDHTKQLANAIANGSRSLTPNVRCVSVESANYKRDVLEWADVVVLGSGVFNGNADPSILSFVNSFDFLDDLSGRVGGSFATGGGAAAGLQPVLEQLNRALMNFRMVLVGGDSWQSGEGTAAVVPDAHIIDSETLQIAVGHGARLARVAAALKSLSPPPAPPPVPNVTNPPAFGKQWAATISANMTMVGYDAGLVIVNFTGECDGDPAQQKMNTVYGDFYTVLTRCDIGLEFTIAPPSRGGACSTRHIGRDSPERLCQACSCPFCVRDTNGSFTHGEHSGATTLWQPKQQLIVDGRKMVVYRGRATSTSAGGAPFDLQTDVAYSAVDGVTPTWVNVSHPLWVSTSARIDDYAAAVPPHAFDIPSSCNSFEFSV